MGIGVMKRGILDFCYEILLPEPMYLKKHVNENRPNKRVYTCLKFFIKPNKAAVDKAIDKLFVPVRLVDSAER